MVNSQTPHVGDYAQTNKSTWRAVANAKPLTITRIKKVK